MTAKRRVVNHPCLNELIRSRRVFHTVGCEVLRNPAPAASYCGSDRCTIQSAAKEDMVPAISDGDGTGLFAKLQVKNPDRGHFYGLFFGYLMTTLALGRSDPDGSLSTIIPV